VELWEILDENGNKTGVIKARNSQLNEGEYHLVVQVWIMNSDGEFLVSRRDAKKAWPLMWECTGGSAEVGEDSLAAALKEVREELGVELDPKNGEMYLSGLKRSHFIDAGMMLLDVWIFRQDVDLADVVLQEGETCYAAYMVQEQILKMIDEGSFIGFEFYPYLSDLFAYTKSPKFQDK